MWFTVLPMVSFSNGTCRADSVVVSWGDNLPYGDMPAADVPIGMLAYEIIPAPVGRTLRCLGHREEDKEQYYFLARGPQGLMYELDTARVTCEHPEEYRAPLSGDGWVCGLCDQLV